MLDTKRYFYKFRNLENRIAERVKNAITDFWVGETTDYSEVWEKLEKMMKEG